jgi:DNA polymerase III epsilon subunit family exonuclease
MTGVRDASIRETPIAVVDFETTGLSPETDRVIEVSVVRLDPDGQARVVFDTLINPSRSVSATHIHGISDDDVRDAPHFEDIVHGLIDALAGCVFSAYNVYFDMGFLRAELQRVGIYDVPPHLCLMHMRPMLGLGRSCNLAKACELHEVDYRGAHVAGHDALASARLLEYYLDVMGERRIQTFGELAELRSYQFTRSFSNPPLATGPRLQREPAVKLASRMPDFRL